MPRRAPKKYNVTITYCEHTPEEEAHQRAGKRGDLSSQDDCHKEKRGSGGKGSGKYIRGALPHEVDKLRKGERRWRKQRQTACGGKRRSWDCGQEERLM